MLYQLSVFLTIKGRMAMTGRKENLDLLGQKDPLEKLDYLGIFICSPFVFHKSSICNLHAKKITTILFLFIARQVNQVLRVRLELKEVLDYPGTRENEDQMDRWDHRALLDHKETQDQLVLQAYEVLVVQQ